MSQKHTHAWKTLVSYISKGDVVRAMALYRLLATTLEDPVYAKKLKADILWSFGRPEALQEYVQMAHHCEQKGHLDDALSIVKMLMTIAPETQDYHLLYAKLQRRHKTQ